MGGWKKKSSPSRTPFSTQTRSQATPSSSSDTPSMAEVLHLPQTTSAISTGDEDSVPPRASASAANSTHAPLSAAISSPDNQSIELKDPIPVKGVDSGTKGANQETSPPQSTVPIILTKEASSEPSSDSPSSGTPSGQAALQLSDTNTSSPADPRWPLLRRWSTISHSSVPIPAKESQLDSIVSGVTHDSLTEIDMAREISKSRVDSHPPTSNPKDVGSSPHISVAGIDSSPIPEVISEPEKLKTPTSSTPKGAWANPLLINSPPLRNVTKEQPFKVSLNDQSKDSVEVDSATLKAYSKEYPWSAKMNQSLRNLNRVTIPEYMEDGTPKVRIPSHVLLGGIENQKEFVVGQFYRCLAPSGGQIHAVATRIWGRKCRIFTRKLGESTYLFHIPDESTRKWIIQRALWHVDDCLMFVSAWSPTDTITLPEITTAPVWLTLKNIPDQLFSIERIKWIASGIGEPMLTEKPWLDPTKMGEAKILVEVKLDRPFPQKVALEDKSGALTMVDVLYSWLPTKCRNCGQLGHKASHCLLPKSDALVLGSELVSINSVISNELAQVSVSASRFSPTDRSESEKQGLLKPMTVVQSSTTTLANENATIISDQETALDLVPKSAGTSIISTSLPAHVDASATTHQSHTALLSTKEATTSKQVSSPSVQVEQRLRKSLSAVALSTNRFAELQSSDDGDESQISDEDNDMLDLLTPSGKRILRERPVKPSTKAKEMQGQSVASGRGNRGRRGGRG